MTYEDTRDQDEQALPAGIHLPRPTVWPMVLALGIVLSLSGIVLTPYFILAGLIVMAIGLAGWIREIRRE